MKIAIIVSSPMTLKAFLRDQIIHLSDSHHLTIVANTKDPTELMISADNIVFKHIEIVRKISIWKDLRAFFALLSLFNKNNFDLVYSVTPKAGLLAMFASFLVRIHCRIHTFTGQVWVTRTGIARLLLKGIDKLLAKFATHLLADSVSQMNFLVNEKVVAENKIKVLAGGSISGVDMNRFKTDIISRNEIRTKLEIDDRDLVFVFIGRLDLDKGVVDLVDAFKLLVSKHTFVKLILVGPDEANIKNQILKKTQFISKYVRFVDFTEHPENYMNAADILCLPSYREGFGSVVIEAAAVGIPAIGSDIYGIKDAIENNVTGLLFPVRDVHSLFGAMETMVLDEKRRLQFGVAAKERVKSLFSQNHITNAFIDYFENVVGDNCAG